ncbi:SusC/RagA family TonB-linked outer membrane protein [Chitinophaga nivalis]|uniref:SusC/RagA family TonB-linked outer membrane protein n=1 Tax=Chitinophaga nivalis TaxID=2991709 RepID=A0ABT3INA1_9BACT|nr:SusC/RagA family TonB-linked outer membrane protein [Chitinophaga nivalis]MCW3464874.1 SusC/RagA family TonB-linked outer membrane protein [Chitinophaga nivalis]MCW3485435.1 SusC/RagA family TonB-linked outer membrane protein [Chitinophaga nivalis]
MKKGLFLWLFVAISVMHAYAQTRTITGKVTDARDGSPLPGVNILIKGSGKGTVAGPDGSFKLQLPTGAALEFSFVGYISQTVSPDGTSAMNIQLKAGNTALNELVVTALGIKRDKRTLTYATQEVKGAAIVDAKQNNLVNALSGKVAGVQITNSSGMPGSSARIVIRGNSSLTGENQALLVVDGIPMDNGEAGNPDGSLSGGGTVNRASDIDPNIIESINVLKGAAATALYGAAAARGAVIITTKNGMGGIKNGRPTVAFSSSYSFENPILPKFQDKYAQGSEGQYVDGNNGEQGSGSWGPLIDTLKVKGVAVPKRDNVKDFFKTGHTTDNNVTVSGFTENSNYLVSYSYLKTDGTMPNTNYSRHALFAKYGTKLLKNLQLTTQFNYISSDNNRLLEGNSLASPLWTVYSAPISWNPKPSTNADDGSQRVFRAARNNPYWLADNTGLRDRTNRILPVINLSYSPLPWLTIIERLGADMYVNNTDYHENIGIIGSTSTDGRLYTRQNQFQQFNNDLMIQIKKDFGKDWTTDLILGNNILTNYNNSNFVQGVGLSVPGLYNVANASNVSSTYHYYRSRKVGFYGQATIEYKKMLTLGLTGRYDGSSVLSKDKQFYPYGSVSAGFIFTEPLKMADNPIFNFGKIRVSYSAVGNDNVPPYSLTTPFIRPTSIGNITFPFNGQNGYQLSTTYAFPLRNEKVKEFEIGLETKFFRNRASLDISYFDKKSLDLLTPGTPISGATGFAAASLNAGDMRNRGVEVVLNVTPVKTKNFTWEVGVNYTKIKNEVLRLSEGLNSLFFAGFTNPGIYAFANQPYGVIMGSHFKRNEGGQLLLDDEGYPQLADDLAPIGNVTPNWTGGITNTLTYKGLTFSFVLDYKNGGDILNLDNHYLYFYGTPKVTENRGTSTVFPGLIESTQKENTKSVVLTQSYYQNIFSSADETSVEDGSYLKLRQVSLGYNFGHMLKHSPFKSLVLNVTGTNFILHKNYTGSDPEVSLNGSGNGQGLSNFMAPANHSIILGLKASF